jgi:hypothetical protein
MKPSLLKVFSCLLFTVVLFNSGQLFGQGGITPGAEVKQAKGESAKPSPSSLKGEYSRDAACVDLIVKKGCVNYTVCVQGDKTCDKATPVKVCSDPKSTKPTNICRKGAKRITVKYEKQDVNTVIEFKAAKSDESKK